MCLTIIIELIVLLMMMMMMNCFCGMFLFPAGTIARDSHHRESPTRREQGLSLRRAWVQA